MKKSDKKQTMISIISVITLWIIAIVAAYFSQDDKFLSSNTGGNTDKFETKTTESVDVDNETMITDVDEFEESSSIEENENTTQQNIADKEQNFKEELQNWFGQDAMVEFHKNNKVFYIVPMSDTFIMEISEYSNPTSPYNSDWHALVADLTRKGGEINSYLGRGYSIKMVNPSNYERILINIENGLLEYSAFKIK